MIVNSALLQLLNDIADSLNQGAHIDPRDYAAHLHHPGWAIQIIDILNKLPEEDMDEQPAFYSACLFFLELYVAEMQTEAEAGSKAAERELKNMMAHLAATISTYEHTLSFWLPVLNAFYEVQVELTPQLKEAYVELTEKEPLPDYPDEKVNLHAIQDLMQELADLSAFDIADHFFAQSYALPADLYADFIVDLFQVDRGEEIAILSLLHPDSDVRMVVFEILANVLDEFTLSPISLSRLQTIKSWYPKQFHAQFTQWLKTQRKKGVIFNIASSLNLPLHIKASEIDGSGAQGIFLKLKTNKKNRLGGLLFKAELGIKDAWLTPALTAKEVQRYYSESFKDSVQLRHVDMAYLHLLVNHFLALTLEREEVPNLHLLELQEELGLHFTPRKLNPEALIENLSVQISPFTPQILEASLKRSGSWTKNKRFTESWFVENAKVDKLVNQCCSIVDGVKVCRFDEAMQAVFTHELEAKREHWRFHFLWVALWLKASSRKQEKSWEDSFLIAYAIYMGRPLNTIPLLKEICYQTVVNSMETMHERRTHLSRQ